MSAKEEEDELRNLRDLEMALRLNNILMSGYSRTLNVVFTLLSMEQRRYEIEDADIICRYLEHNKKMIGGEGCCSLLLPPLD
jgi:hypothetical protein